MWGKYRKNGILVQFAMKISINHQRFLSGFRFQFFSLLPNFFPFHDILCHNNEQNSFRFSIDRKCGWFFCVPVNPKTTSSWSRCFSWDLDKSVSWLGMFRGNLDEFFFSFFALSRQNTKITSLVNWKINHKTIFFPCSGTVM